MTLGAPQPDDVLYRLPLGHLSNGTPMHSAPYASVIGTGAPRTGKTRGIAVPAVASFPGSAVIVSVRGDLYEQTKHSRGRRGRVAVFDPGALFPDAPERVNWNLIGRCSDFQVAIELAQALADSGVPKSGSGNTEWHFWAALGRKLVAPSLYAAASNGYTMEDVVRWIQTREEFEVRSLLQATGNDTALQMIDGIWTNESRALSSIYATADSMIGGFEAPTLAAAVNGGIDLPEFLAEDGNTLYVIVPATRQGVYIPVVTSLLGAVLDAAAEKAESTNAPARMLVLLDEAGNIGQIPELRSRATTSMGYGITMVSLFHDVAQIRRVYGAEEAQTILAAHQVFMALRGTDIHTATYLDALIGSDPDPSLPRGTGVARLRRIPVGEAISVVGGDEPQMLTLPSLDDPLLRIELGL